VALETATATRGQCRRRRKRTEQRVATVAAADSRICGAANIRRACSGGRGCCRRRCLRGHRPDSWPLRLRVAPGGGHNYYDLQYIGLAAPIVGGGRRRQREGQEGKRRRCRQRRERRAPTVAAAEASTSVGGRRPDWLPLQQGDNLCLHCSRQFVRYGDLVHHMINQDQEEMGFTADVPTVVPASPPSAPAASLEAQAGGTPANPKSISLSLPLSGRDPIGDRAGQPATPPGASLPPTPPSLPPNASSVPVLGTTAEKVRSYYAAFGDMERTRMLVSSSSSQSSQFDTSELKDMRLFSLSAGGKGLSQKARAEYYQSTGRDERAALRAQRDAEAAALGKVFQDCGLGVKTFSVVVGGGACAAAQEDKPTETY